MTEKNTHRKHTRIFCRSLLTASLCAGLLLAGCSSNQPQEPAADTGSAAVTASTAETASAAATAQKAGEDSTAAAGSAAAATTESAATSTTGAQYADPDWSPEEQNEVFSAKGKGLVIVIDPGHASQVPGTTEPIGPGASEMKDADTQGTYGPASGLHEYELTMNVSHKLRTELEERGYEVKLTHHDTFNPISCIERAAVANENKADAFIRIHANGSENTEANGAMTICITRDNPYHPELYSASARLSEILLQTYCEQTGAKMEYVNETDTMTGNNWAEVPTTLIELGYMTNPDEDLKMNQDSYQKVMVNAIADGLDKWFAQMPEDELSMHPSLTEEKSDSADTSSTSENAETAAAGEGAETGETGETADAAQTDDAGETDETDSTGETDGTDNTGETDETDDTEGTADTEEAGDSNETDDAAAVPASGTPAGTSSGNGTGVSADTDSE